MADINAYANDLLIEFLDAMHDKLRQHLSARYGEAWFTDGVQPHLNSNALERTREMLEAPMAIIDMEKTDEELYGVEHLSNIVLGNWISFADVFGDRNRAQVYFGEITELRHNVSHRRQHHMLSRGELLRFMRNAQLLLSALESPLSLKFESIAIAVEQGDTPWGNELFGLLPPAADIVSDFVGREEKLRELRTWLTLEDARQLVIWGYGGSGKTSLAYHFARAVRYGAPSSLQAVVWLSAKQREYIEGESYHRTADFDSVETFSHALWNALYDDMPNSEQCTRGGIVAELSDTPSLVVVDDLDTVLEDEDLAYLLLYELPKSRSRVLYTTRQRVPGLQTIDVEGFDETELLSFLSARSSYYALDPEQCIERSAAILSVTDGYPLFVDDLMRQAMFGGLEDAIGNWSQRKGDTAREYALRRQLSSLGDASQRALIGVGVANRPVTSLELSNISGFPDDDIQRAIADLLSWRLINRLEADATGRPTFSCNRNTQRLVQKTYARDPVFQSYQASFRSLTGHAPSPALRRAVSTAINNTRALVQRNDFESAEQYLEATMIGELRNNADLWGVRGWVMRRKRTGQSIAQAREAFKRAHELGSTKEDTFFHWVGMERDIGENLVNRASDQELLKQWRAAAHVAELGIDRCGETPYLCQIAAYLRTREAKTLEYLREFTSAQNCFRQGAEWARRAIVAPNPSTREVDPSQTYRTLVIALDGAGEPEQAVEALRQWESLVGSEDPDLRREKYRLAALPEYRDHFGLS